MSKEGIGASHPVSLSPLPEVEASNGLPSESDEHGTADPSAHDHQPAPLSGTLGSIDLPRSMTRYKRLLMFDGFEKHAVCQNLSTTVVCACVQSGSVSSALLPCFVSWIKQDACGIWWFTVSTHWVAL